VCVPRFSKPVEQASSHHHLLLQNNQLDGTYLALLHCLSNQHAPEPEPIMMEDVPMLVVEIEEIEGEAVELVPVVVEEVENQQQQQQQQQQEYEPYQLTCYYRNQLE
jgi:hypothetical protein